MTAVQTMTGHELETKIVQPSWEGEDFRGGRSPKALSEKDLERIAGGTGATCVAEVTLFVVTLAAWGGGSLVGGVAAEAQGAW
jgi:hypothetical protein